ncbi:hypothetical protein GDO86_015698 [Hymenochirus boettgeri]|uniref:Coiled-coil domain containing 9 n=1 Tax=Hymenochirus boettgeri TaxID=247094 RepID=A0A8T2JYZ9_9PIPI|nr:hypothetical protein GDO86_015698 [Hymenochirus boettgeri]
MASVVDLKSKEEKDAELDKKIEALRKKNEALIKRHQLIEEDRKRAEQEGIAVTTPRKAKNPEAELDKSRKEKENFSITLDVSDGEKRILNNAKPVKSPQPLPHKETSPRSPTRRNSGRISGYCGGRSPNAEQQPEPFVSDDDFHSSKSRRSSGRDGHRRNPRLSGDALLLRGGSSHGSRGSGRVIGAQGRGVAPGDGDSSSVPDRRTQEWEEKRRQNIEKMNEEMEKIAEYERSRRDGVREKNPSRNFLDDPRRLGPMAEGDRKEGSRRHNRNWGGADFEKGRRPAMKNQMDMTLSMTGRERAEYVRWKKEREQIDQERLARHRKPTGQWRREWDAEKTDSMFKDDASPHIEDESFSRREKGKRGAPKPPTMGEFFPEKIKDPSQKRDNQRGHGWKKPYSMHDSRWEEPELEKDVEVSEKAEKETCVEKEEKVEETKIEPQKELDTEVSEEIEGEEDDDGWEDFDEEEDEGCSDASLTEKDQAEEELPPISPAASEPPAKVQTSKEINEEKPVESIPTSPFLPETSRITSDWGEEMEMVSPVGSNTENTLPQPDNSMNFSSDDRFQDNFSHKGYNRNRRHHKASY